MTIEQQISEEHGNKKVTILDCEYRDTYVSEYNAKIGNEYCYITINNCFSNKGQGLTWRYSVSF